jgi:hypothetical protein
MSQGGQHLLLTAHCDKDSPSLALGAVKLSYRSAEAQAELNEVAGGY